MRGAVAHSGRASAAPGIRKKGQLCRLQNHGGHANAVHNNLLVSCVGNFAGCRRRRLNRAAANGNFAGYTGVIGKKMAFLKLEEGFPEGIFCLQILRRTRRRAFFYRKETQS